MSGIQEILVLLILILGLFFMPRVMGRGRSQEGKAFSFKSVSGKMRAAIAVSFFYMAIFVLVLEPWHHQRLLFVSVGLGPVALGWTIFWVVNGFKGRKKK